MTSLLHTASQRLLHLNKMSRVAGVECFVGPDGAAVYQLVLLEIVKEMATMKTSREQVENLSELTSMIPRDTPVALSIHGRGIIHRKLTAQEDTPERIIHTMLPNARAADFYFQKYQNEHGNFCSAARKSAIDLVLTQFHEAGLPVVACSFGPMAVVWTAPLLNGPTESISVKGFQLHFRDKQLYDFSSKAGEPVSVLTIGNEQLSQRLLTAYASAFQLLLPGVEIIEAEIDHVGQVREELNHKKLFSLLGWGVLGFFLVLLLVNFICFSIFSEKNKALVARQSQIQGMLTNFSNLEKEVKEKEAFLGNAGWLKSSKATVYSDLIASTIPASVRLTGLAVYPMDERRSRTDKKEIFDPGQIRIEGICARPTELNPWLNKMDKLPGIKDAHVSNYTYDPKDAKGNFIIHITLEEN